MAKERNETVTGMDVRCLKCRNWSRAPVFATPFSTFETSAMAGNQYQCPHCHRMSDCNKENFRLRFAGGGFKGSATN